LTALHGALTGTPASNVLVVGDFNMGPSDADGRLGDAASVWNNETDRAPFRRLLADVGLVDLGAASAPHAFTLERAASGGRHSAFRCDLALASIPLAPLLTLTYDHSVRERTHGFTDHSALIVDLAGTR
jgi:hypothetical protein